ncbi:unnamed protein product [Rotaria magnacalcarata]|uniref:Uncharacterized protein n=1 Tax=Rotaria magnacalcarata TaxID=392030 RepID=A0A816PH72_9BILA|nr:unnamed protein product [Rotaria magnacalcarata]CAF4098903.1 unnamed protein product [Rotaria magnacalcarata]
MKGQLLSWIRMPASKWIKILVIFTIFLSLYIYLFSKKIDVRLIFRQVPKETYYVKRYPFTFNATIITLNSSNTLIRIYEQQFSRYTAAPFLPNFENHRLMLKFNVRFIATYLYGNVDSFQGAIRCLLVACLQKHKNETMFVQYFDLNICFNVQKLNAQAIHFTLNSITAVEPFLIISKIPINKQNDLITRIIVHVNRICFPDTIFSFKYQWLDANVLNDLYWPQWPLKKSCADHMYKHLLQNRTDQAQIHFSCSITSILTHSTSRQLFNDERIAITHWLDAQYKSTRTDSSFTQNPLVDQLSSTARTRRLSPYELASNSNVCSVELHRWILKYQDWHESVSLSISDPSLTFEQQRDRIVDQNVRFMLYEKSTSGIADRIVHLMTTYLVAMLTNRLLVFDPNWPEFSHLMLSSLNYERESIIPWFRTLKHLNSHFSRNSTNYLTSGHYAFSFDRLNRDYDYDRQFPERILIFRAHTGGIIHTMMSQTSVYRKFLTEDLRMSADNMFGCLYHSLILYRLSALIEITSVSTSTHSPENEQLGHTPQQLLQVLLSPNFYPIGIQVRTGDTNIRGDNPKSWFKFVTGKKSLLPSFEYFFACARDIVDGNQTFLTNIKQVSIAFLISDTTRLRRAALLRWKLPSSCIQSFGNTCRNHEHGLPVIANSNPVLHVAYTSEQLLALRMAIFDIFLFSLCEQHVISAESGFGSIGVFAALKQRNIYSLSTLNKRSCRGRNQHISLVASSYQWSGIR